MRNLTRRPQFFIRIQKWRENRLENFLEKKMIENFWDQGQTCQKMPKNVKNVKKIKNHKNN